MIVGNQAPVLADVLSAVRLFVFDLDGTLYCGDQPVEGAHRTVEALQRLSSVAFLTNNSSRASSAIHEKLVRLGFVCDARDVYCSASSTASYLRKSGIDQVYVVGSPDLADEIARSGGTLATPETATALVVGMDNGFSYAKIADALTVLVRGGTFIVCNEDASFPVESGRLLPGCGAMVGAIRGASGRAPDIIIGKPATYMLDEIAAAHDLQPHQIMMVGDQWSSDVQIARNFGCSAFWLHDGAPGASLPSAPGVWHIRTLDELLRHCRDHLDRT